MKSSFLCLSYLLAFVFLTSCEGEELVDLSLPENLMISSQPELDMYRDLLLDTEVFEGNIHLMKNRMPESEVPIFDLSAFRNLKKVNGNFDIGRNDCTAIDAFVSLEEVTGRLFVSSRNASTIDFPKLRVAGELIMTFNDSLRTIKMDNLEEVGFIQISENFLLESMTGFHKLVEVPRLIISNNHVLSVIDGFSQLERVDFEFVLEVYPVKLLNGCFEKVQFVERFQCSVNEENALNFDWVNPSITSNSMFIRGDLDLEDACPFINVPKTAPRTFALMNRYGSVFYGDDLLEVCQ